MEDSLKHKLSALVERHAEIASLLVDPDIINQRDQYQKLNKEYAKIDPIVTCYQALQACEERIMSANALLTESDPELKLLAEEEKTAAQSDKTGLESELTILLLPQDPNDDRNIFLEVRAGTGGHEAALFAGVLFRMYCRYAEKQGWQVEIINESEGEQGGYKEVIARVIGHGVYSKLKFESGAHRVQRVPVTESQGRVHTSACTVAILPEAEEIDAIEINPSELRIDTFRASGAGGQHVNKTDSAIRLTHLPTGIVVECQDERSQHKNRARAMSLLQAKLLSEQQEKQAREQAQTRKTLVGSGDRSERIRTYNYPQGRVTDHRINLTLYKLEDIVAGDLNDVIGPLAQAHQADLLASLAK